MTAGKQAGLVGRESSELFRDTHRGEVCDSGRETLEPQLAHAVGALSSGLEGSSAARLGMRRAREVGDGRNQQPDTE